MPFATPESTPRIVLGVAGGIAAYKSVELLRRFRDAGYFVSPVLTPDATRFVGALTFSALASEPARVSLYGDLSTPIPHTHLGQHADLIVVAPATAHLIARYAMGLADDLLCATLLASRAPVLLCPAMHTEMWEQPSVQENLATLRRRGVMVLEPDEGHLAGGDSGAGRLPDPERIFELVQRILEGYRGVLTSRRVLVSAGGTREPVDPVRVMTNRSSGRQGYALAEVAARFGAEVTLVTTVQRELALDVRSKVKVVNVETAQELAAAMLEHFAAFTFDAAEEKLKRGAGLPVLTPVATVDVVRELVALRRRGQLVVAFAAETTDLAANAQRKLKEKDVDLLVANDVTAPEAGFSHPTNEVVLMGRDGSVQELSLRSKESVAEAILTKVASLFTQGVS